MKTKLKIAQVHPGCGIPVPPPDWGAIEKIVWEFHCNSINLGHESHIKFINEIHLGLADHISLGNLDAKRDWGYAPDYVEAMWLMLQQDTPEDYVIATGDTWSIRDFLDEAFLVVGIADWEPYVKIDPKFMRPAEVDILIGDCTKAKTELNWNPKTSFKDMVHTMVNNDIKLLQ